MASMLGGIATSKMWLWIQYLAFGFFFLLICLGITGFIIWLVIRSKQTKVIEVTAGQHMKIYAGKMKKRRGTDIMQFYSKKDKRSLPLFQQNDEYYNGKSINYILYRDKNGLVHSLRVPTYKQIKKWYGVMYNVDLDDKKVLSQPQKALRTIYFQPNPHENIDWLANQVVEADKEFKDMEWWQHPNVMIAASIGGAAFIQVVNLMILYLMHK